MTDPLLDELTTALGGVYTIARELHGGGMSRVFVARERALDREVVIKVLPPELAAGMNHERFRREIQFAAQLAHPYIVPLLSAGEAGGLLWFTMPFIRGESLRIRLERDGPLTVDEVVQLLRDVMEALVYAHSRGVIHRDIKPANILSDGGHAQVTDFGVAKALGAALPLTGVAGHTTSGVAIGTPAYMAPEQLAADPAADHRVDIYGLGLVAYELLTGRTPFSGRTPAATMTAQLTEMPAPVNRVRRDVPLALSQLVERCLAKDPADRPATAQMVLDELDRIETAVLVEGEGSRGSRAALLPIVSAIAGISLIGAVALWRMPVVGPVADPASRDTVFMMAGRDEQSGEPLDGGDDRPMTRADSLAIAQAMYSELAGIDPEAHRTASTPGTVPLEAQMRMIDSMVNVRLREVMPMPGPGGPPRVGRPEGRPEQLGPEPRVVIYSGSPRGDTSGHAADASRRFAENINRALDRGGWETAIAVPGVPPRLSDSTYRLFVGMDPVNGDSLELRIVIRSSPGVPAEVLRIATFPRDVSDAAYRQAIGSVLTKMDQLRRTAVEGAGPPPVRTQGGPAARPGQPFPD